MISHRLAAALHRRDWHYGWVVIAATFFAMLVSAGAMGSLGVMIRPLEQEFHWQTSEISTALAIRIALYGLMGPFAAALMNRFGVRSVTLAALLLIVIGLMASLAMTRVWQLILLWGVVIGFGTGMTAIVLGATVATRWFTKRRGLAVGMLTASSATGQLVFLPAIAAVTEHYGWRLALCLVSAMLALAALAVSLLLRNRPHDLGLLPYGEIGIAGAAPVSPPALASPFAALKEASGNRTFWILFGTFFICGVSTTGLIQTHFISMCGDYGLAAVSAASVLAMMGAFDFVGTIGSGWLSDRLDNRYLLFWYYGLRGLSLLYLPFTTFTIYGLSLFAMFYGLDWIATVPPTVKLTSQEFGREKTNLVFGWIFAGHQLGGAAAAFGAGLSRTVFASYLPAFFIAGALCLVAAVAALTIGRRRMQLQPAE